MESLFVEQSLSPRKQMKTPKRKPYHHLNHHPDSHHSHHHHRHNNHHQISRGASLNQNYAPFSAVHVEFDNTMMHGGFFLNNHPTTNTTPYQRHQPLSTSLPPMFLLNHHQQQPPLLPLPAVARPSFRSLPTLTRGKSLSSHVHRKSPSKTKSPQKSNNVVNNNNNDQYKSCEVGKDRAKDSSGDEDVNGPAEESGPSPSPSSVQRDIAKLLLADLDAVVAREMDKFSGSVFSLAPPPSSLPLPKFSLRRLRNQRQPKLSCNA